MPTIDKPAAAGIRERALRSALARRDAYLEKAEQTELALQDRRSAELSPLELDLQRQALAYHRSQLSAASELVQIIRNQNAAIQADRDANPMRPAARRNPSPAAILGILERERRRTAPLSRGAYARAQAVAASRSKYDLKQAYRLSGTLFSQDASFRGEASFYDLRGVDVPTPFGPDPCVEYLRKQRARREVMFARGLARHGYRVAHSQSPC